MQHIVLGNGEVGFSLYKVLGNGACIYGKHDTAMLLNQDNITFHICFPYDGQFESEVKKYQEMYKPKYTIIHSTVPVGTSRKLNALHSPIIGKHPDLEESIRTFTKFIGGEQASEVADCFRRLGLKVYLFKDQETTELMKILDTTFYGVCVEYTKDVKRLAEEYKVPFEAWTLWTDNYNRGYQKLGYPEYTRPNLVPIEGKIGGHCVSKNAELIDTKFTKLLRDE